MNTWTIDSQIATLSDADITPSSNVTHASTPDMQGTPAAFSATLSPPQPILPQIAVPDPRPVPMTPPSSGPTPTMPAAPVPAPIAPPIGAQFAAPPRPEGPAPTNIPGPIPVDREAFERVLSRLPGLVERADVPGIYDGPCPVCRKPVMGLLMPGELGKPILHCGTCGLAALLQATGISADDVMPEAKSDTNPRHLPEFDVNHPLEIALAFLKAVGEHVDWNTARAAHTDHDGTFHEANWKADAYGLRFHGGDAYEYWGNIWHKICPSDVEARLRQWLERSVWLYASVSDSRGGCTRAERHVVNRLVAEVLAALEAECHVPSTATMPCWLYRDRDTQQCAGLPAPEHAISVTNGILVMDPKSEPRTIAHRAAWFDVAQLPYGYDPAATCPVWDRCVEEWSGGEAVWGMLSHEYFG